MEHGIQVIG